MKYHRCENPNCKANFLITEKNVERKYVVRGYKYEDYEYYVRCPACGIGEKVKFSELPLNVIWNFIKIWFKKYFEIKD